MESMEKDPEKLQYWQKNTQKKNKNRYELTKSMLTSCFGEKFL